MPNKVFSQGSATVSIPASSKIAILSDSPVSLYQEVGYPQLPASWDLVATTEAGVHYVSSAFSAATNVRVDVGASDAYYSVGTAPSARETPIVVPQGAPAAKTTAVTLTIAELLTGIVTATHTAGATAAYTLPTGTLADAGADLSIDESFDWSLINLSAAAADTVTVTAGTAHTIVGNAIVQSVHASTGLIYGSSGRFRTRKTAANTFVTYRIS